MRRLVPWILAFAVSGCFAEEDEAADSGVSPDAAGEVGGRIWVSHSALAFESVPHGSTKSLSVVVKNIGDADLELAELLLNGAPDFSPVVADRDPRRFEAVLEDPDEDGQPGLAPGAAATLVVALDALTTGPLEAALMIRSSDVTQPETTISLSAQVE